MPKGGCTRWRIYGFYNLAGVLPKAYRDAHGMTHKMANGPQPKASPYRAGKNGLMGLALLISGVFVLLPLGLTAVGSHVLLVGIYDPPVLPWAPVILAALCGGLLTARVGRLLWRRGECAAALTIMRDSQGPSRMALIVTVLTGVSSLLAVGLTHQRGGVADVAAALLGNTIVAIVLTREVWRQFQGWRADFRSLLVTLLPQIVRDFHDELRAWQQVDGPSLVGTRGDLFRVQMQVVESYLERYPELIEHEAEIYQALEASLGA